MSSICHSLKQEYDALKTLTQEFVSACAKAGDPRAFSSEQLREIQVAKQKLEQARDALTEKIENKETKTWKMLLETVTSSIIEDGDSIYDGKSIAEYVGDEAFQESIVNEIINFITSVGPLNGSSAWAAVVNSLAALRSGLLNEDREAMIRTFICDENLKTVLLQYITSDVRGGVKRGEPGWYAVTGLNAASFLGVLTDDESDGILRQMHIESFQENLGQVMVNEAIDGCRDGFKAAHTLIGLQATLATGVLPELYRKEIQSRVVEEGFKVNLLQCVLQGASTKFSDRDNLDIVGVIGSLKGLIALSRQQRARTM